MMTRKNVYIRHRDPNLTGEGLGSHARGTLYPLLRIAQRFHWTVVWEPQSPCWQSNQSRPEYKDECAELGPWLGFDKQYDDLDENSLIVVPIDLDNDQRLGRILGYAGILINSIDEYRQQHGDDAFYCCPSSDDKQNILISLHGRFQYQDDPTATAIRWMQSTATMWKNQQIQQQGQHEDSQQSTKRIPDDEKIKIVAHIRVPEDYCPQEWKDANSVDHIVSTLQTIQQQMDGQKGMYTDNSVLHVFTESTFSDDNEAILRRHRPDLTIHRQTPLLDAVRQMATADILVPACSYLSAFAGFFQTSLIVLPNEEIRHSKYFAPHLKYDDDGGGDDDDDDNIVEAKCPIVRVEDTERLMHALEQVLGKKGGRSD